MDTVLVVEDEPPISRALTLNLQARGYEVSEATTGAGALDALTVVRPAMVILDLGLPDIDGVQVIRRLRARSPVPILVLSARRDERQEVEALDAGADDYVTKPFGMDELLARVRALGRRVDPGAVGGTAVIRTEAFEMDMTARDVTKRGRYAHLTPTEWGIVEALVRRPGHLVTRDQVLTEVWGVGFDDASAYVRAHLRSIRRKLEPEPARPRYFVTVPRLGFRFVPDPEEPH